LGAPSSSWQGLFGNVGAQGSQFDRPLSPSGQYYAFLSKADPAGGTYGPPTPPPESSYDTAYDVLFELVSKEWMDNVVFSPPIDVRQTAPTPPALLYHVWNVPTDAILKALGLSTTDDLAEGSWYLISLTEGDKGAVVGDLYDPDIDWLPPGPRQAP
jgi:hypothetical protein